VTTLADGRTFERTVTTARSGGIITRSVTILHPDGTTVTRSRQFPVRGAGGP
jgi:hypothetical protein